MIAVKTVVNYRKIMYINKISVWDESLSAS